MLGFVLAWLMVLLLGEIVIFGMIDRQGLIFMCRRSTQIFAFEICCEREERVRDEMMCADRGGPPRRIWRPCLF